MAIKLGSPRTTKFSIGTAELRIGPQAVAMKLKQEHSVGLIDNATVEVSQESVDLSGGFPKVLVDTAVVSQESSITATLREYSRRNLQVMLGEGVVPTANEPADVSTTCDATTAAGETAVSVTAETGFAAADVVVFFGATDTTKAEVTVGLLAGTAAGELQLSTDTPLLHGVVNGDVVYLANQVAIGAIVETNYFACQLLQVERASARPIGFDFWKGAIGGGMTFATNAEDFASTELNIKLLQPAATEYASGASMEHLAGIIPNHPTGMYFGGGDA